MPIVQGELLFFGTSFWPEDDTNTVGGAIDRSLRPIFTSPLSSPSILKMVFDHAGDVGQTYRITGRVASGAIQTDDFVSAGIGSVTGTVNFSHIEKGEKISGPALNGTAAVQRTDTSAEIIRFDAASLAPGGVEIAKVSRAFYNTVSDPDNPKTVYYKVFARNCHASLSLLDAAIYEITDPTALVTFALGTSLNDTLTAANRLTAPAGGLTFDDNFKTVVGTNLAAGDAQPVWIKLALGTGELATYTYYDLRIRGASAG